MPMFAILQKRKLWGYWTKSYQNSTQCRKIHATNHLKSELLQSVLEWQRENEDWSAKNGDFATLIGCHVL